MQKKKTKQKVHIEVLLHDIRSVYNVGSIFRTSDALGVNKIYLSGYTPAPVDRFQRVRSDIAKVALGAEKAIPWEVVGDPKKLIKDLKKKKYKIIALEQSENSIDYKKLKLKNSPILFLVGTEVTGIEKSILDLCDEVIEIPMSGGKESLNVSVAFGIAGFRILDF
jgi:tRNA G18 (ribose-2'-O)-methylase SpoU